MSSIGTDLETWTIALLRAKAVVPVDFQIIREADDDRADVNRIVLAGTRTGASWEGPGNQQVPMSEMQLIAELRTVDADDATAEDYFSKMEKAIGVRPWPNLSEDSLWLVLIPTQSESDDKTQENNTRSRIATFSFLALQAE